MGVETFIEWCHATFNGWIGCLKVSPACAHCFAEVDTPARVSRSQGLELWGPQGVRRVASEAGWRAPLLWDRKAKEAGERRRVFAYSQGDVFEDFNGPMVDHKGRILYYNSAATWWTTEPTTHGAISMRFVRERLFSLIRQTPNLDWLLLTKRPENIGRMLPDDWESGYPNVWLGTSVENQRYADERIPELLKIPALVRFLSVEPLLGPIDFRKVPDFNRIGRDVSNFWVIVGGESGPDARPMHPDWVRSIRDQCQAAGVPFFMKQWGEHVGGTIFTRDDGLYLEAENGQVYHVEGNGFTLDYYDWDETQHESPGSFRVGKRAAGRLLDGREWSELPVPTESEVG